MTKEEIKIAVHEEIRKNEKLGDQAGGSGHLSHISYEINSIETRPLEDGRIEISYIYTTYTETEFTYYPDNPPYENRMQGKFVV